MKFNRKAFTDSQLLDIYKNLLKPRLIEEKMLIALRQGRISKWFSGYGQEAVSVGATMAMHPNEYMLPMHRNLGIFTTRGIPLYNLFSQFQGKADGFTKGRDRSFHFGSKEHHIVGMISHLGPQMGIADGIALAGKLSKEKKATLVITGDGGASQGDFHEAINVAAVWDLPVIFLVENNHWGLSTPSSEQFKFRSFTYKAMGYGIKAKAVDGNNVLDVYQAVTDITTEIRETPGPYILECNTFRMRGHEEASGTKYYPDGLQEKWAKKDPVDNYRTFLLEKGILHPDENEKMQKEIKKEINDAFEKAFVAPEIEFDKATEFADLYAPVKHELIDPSGEAKEARLVDAIHEGLKESMRKHNNLVIMGQDIAEYGGVFKITEGFVEEFGKDRVRNTPLCEAAIVGSALGLSVGGYKAVMEMQFADFVTEGFNQIVNNLAKIHWRWGQNADVVVRMPTGAGVGAGPFHSQSNEAWFTHTPGLKVVYPAFPEDAKGLLINAIDDPNPVMFFEHKALYRSIYGPVPEGYYHVPIGKANLLKEGNDISIITYGSGVHWALEYLNANPEISADLIDLRTLQPLDREAILASAKKTGRVVILQEDVMFGGIASDISSMIMEECFADLDAPVKRVASLDTPVPFAKALENEFLPKKRFAEAVEELLGY
ncbi:alpha-ketoacid dehydrogenase subunit alpha/beta [Owenweeksia hongkongensis]|uniref:alpha-ketoacid dehydrogenase subunit alpha/beta n=1 Tax=Owenweeksia hongkongensis TaxID=253245 RepID=UPI003A93FE01